MPWPIRLIACPQEDFSHVRVGDLWLKPELLAEHRKNHLSPNYFADNASRRMPLVLRIPGWYDWIVDGMFWRAGVAYGDGWKVTGEPPLITCSPSVNIGGYYHGFVENGVIKDDLDGRAYDAEGRFVSQKTVGP